MLCRKEETQQDVSSSFLKIYRVDTAQILKRTSLECRLLKNKLNRVLLSGDAMHTQLREGTPTRMEVFEAGNAFMKIRLKNKSPPLFLRIRYMKQPGAAAEFNDLTLLMSHHNQEPSDESHDGQPHFNVSSLSQILTIVQGQIPENRRGQRPRKAPLLRS